MKQVKHNIIFGLAIGSLFLLLESIFRFNHDNLINYLTLREYLMIIISFIVLSFLKDKFLKILLFLFSLLFIAEVSHFNYFGYFLFPMELILFFTKSHEVFETLNTKLEILIEPAIYAVILYFSIYNISKLYKHRVTSVKFQYLFFLVLIASLAKATVNYKHVSLGDKPNENKSLIKNSFYLSTVFLGKTLPLYLLDIQIAKPYKQTKALVKNSKNKVDNIILIIGESLSLHYMSLYGYHKRTTPQFELLLKNDNDFIALKALSAGLFTDVSIPMILNMAPKPSALQHILSHKSSLFKMAKDNNYKTHFISSQSNKDFIYIRNYMAKKYIDNYIDSSYFGLDKLTSTDDIILLDELKKIDLDSKNNFIVLNMMGSHEPYEKRVPKNFKPFGKASAVNDYENSVAYTDKIISDIIQYIKTKKSKVMLVFSSDHGHHAGKSGYGKGDIRNKKDYEVPLIFYTHNFSLNEKLENILYKNNYISHHTMSLISGYYLGYDTIDLIDKNRAYIIGSDLSGNAGYLEYNLRNGKIKFY